MKNIKMPFSIKIHTFLVLIFSFVIMFISYNIYLLNGNLNSVYIFAGSIYLFIFSLLFLKNPKSLTILHFINYFLFIGGLFGIGYLLSNLDGETAKLFRFNGFEGFFYDIGLYNLNENILWRISISLAILGGLLTIMYVYLVYAFIIYKIRLNKGIEKLGEKYLSENGQSSGVIVSFLFSTFILATFYFLYYNIPYSFNKVPDDYFTTKYQSLLVNDE